MAKDALPVIFIKFRKIVGNPQLLGVSLFPNPNRGWKWPIFVAILPVASLTCFAPEFRQSLFPISYGAGPYSDTDELRSNFVKFREIAGNPPLFGETLFRILIAAGGFPFSEPFYTIVAEMFSIRNAVRP